ncbi:hypothetical protein IEQ34_006448 [Dendrobium chrysotoxum]|uniref:Uncharacterized protein n=1 Tax=Dendrobium chrysotoxum TaxID=161865 RepID=A0AAV7HDW8_DENCH|nr:hypothetical protein IEQ34_006448 [Dendrobium chrysotoxum]
MLSFWAFRVIRLFPMFGHYIVSIFVDIRVVALVTLSVDYQLSLKFHVARLNHWYKDFRWGSQVKDEEGLPAFALVNKATGLAIKHSLGPTHPVRLIPFNPDYLDESILWTESHDTGEGYRCIRMVNNIRLNFDAFNGDKEHGGVHDGTTIVLWEWLKGKNQRWKIRGKAKDSAICDLGLNIIIRVVPEKAGFSCYFLHFELSCVF